MSAINVRCRFLITLKHCWSLNWPIISYWLFSVLLPFFVSGKVSHSFQCCEDEDVYFWVLASLSSAVPRKVLPQLSTASLFLIWDCSITLWNLGKQWHWPCSEPSLVTDYLIELHWSSVNHFCKVYCFLVMGVPSGTSCLGMALEKVAKDVLSVVLKISCLDFPSFIQENDSSPSLI